MSAPDTADQPPSGTAADFRAALARERFLLVAFVAAACRGRALDGEVPDDIVQEALTIAWMRRAEFDVARDLGPWLRGIATNVLIGVVRRAARRRRILADEAEEIVRVQGLADRFDRIARVASERELASGLRECIERLPEAHREVIQRHYAGSEAFGVIAEAMGISEEAAMKRASRARAMLGDCLESKGAVPPGAAGAGEERSS